MNLAISHPFFLLVLLANQILPFSVTVITDKRPINVKGAMIVYNITVVILNTYIAYEVSRFYSLDSSVNVLIFTYIDTNVTIYKVLRDVVHGVIVHF